MEDEKKEIEEKKDYRDNSFSNLLKSKTNRSILYVLAALLFFASGLCLGTHLSEGPESNNFRGHQQFEGQCGQRKHNGQRNNNDNQAPADNDSNNETDRSNDQSDNQPTNKSGDNQPQWQNDEVRIQTQTQTAPVDVTATSTK